VADFAPADVSYKREMQQVEVMAPVPMGVDQMGQPIVGMMPQMTQQEVVTGILSIRRGSYFVPFKFMPGLDGGFHGTGLGLLLGDISRARTVGRHDPQSALFELQQCYKVGYKVGKSRLESQRKSTLCGLDNELFGGIKIGARGNISGHHSISADTSPCPHGDISEDSRTSANNHVIADGGVPFPILKSSGTQSDIVINHDVVTHHRRLANNDTHSVIDKEPSSDSCSRMDLDTSCSAHPVRMNSR
jgi:hypothetical protein